MTAVPTPLRDIAKVVRSKNAGPFEITLDIIFKSKEDYEAVKRSGVITRELVSELYNVPTQAIATTICGKIRTSLMHAPYPGRIATAGNLASPFTPLEIPLGQACEFNVYHLMQVDSPTALFPVQYEEIA